MDRRLQKCFICAFCAVIMISGCSTVHIKHELRRFQKSTVTFSGKYEKIENRCISPVYLEDGEITMVMYYDSTECSECRINQLLNYIPLYELADSTEKFRVITIFSPRQDEYDNVMARLMVLNFEFSVYIDKDSRFRKANPGIPEDRRFHSFLLDRDGHPVFVGDPVASETMGSLFEKALARIGE